MDGEIATIPGAEENTAIRVRRLPSHGTVVLEQLHHSISSGWYVQKSFIIPEVMLNAVVREMRKADCLVTRPHRPLIATSPLRLHLD